MTLISFCLQLPTLPPSFLASVFSFALIVQQVLIEHTFSISRVSFIVGPRRPVSGRIFKVYFGPVKK